MKKQFLFLLLIVLSFGTWAQDDCFPKKPSKERLVNDFAQLLSSQEIEVLERSLVSFNDTTSTQIALVTVNSLCGMDASSMAFQIGEKWGVGDKRFNNGILVLVKPKTRGSRGQAFIASGYGLEGVLPDAIAKRIVEQEMIPFFKKGDYYGGIKNAAIVLMEITGGEYSAEAYKKRSKGSFPFGAALFLVFFVAVMFLSTLGRARNYASRNNMGLWTALWLMGSMNSRHRGHYNNFTSGGGGFGGFGGGGGGFGGFGGGSFGGGGAGGSW